MISRKHPGFALILALIVTTVLFIVAVEYRWSSILELKKSNNLKTIITIDNVARAGLNHMVSLLQSDDCKGSGPGEKWYRFYPGQPDSRQKIFLDEDKRYFYQISCIDEDSKINLNASESPLSQLLRSFGYSGIKLATMQDSLLDWIDTDNEHQLNGKEDSYYQTLKPRYHCKNGPLDSIDEIFLIHGFRNEDPQIFRGENPQHLDLRQLVSVFRGGDIRVNVNTASAKVLELYLELSISQINSIMSYRKTNRAFTAQQAEALVSSRQQSKVKAVSHVFRIQVTAGEENSPLARHLEAVVHLNKDKALTFCYFSEK